MTNPYISGYELMEEGRRLAEQLEILKSALQFYADESRYCSVFTFNPLQPWEEECEMLLDAGAKARKALKEIE